jgi:hypothetical protein
LPPPPLIAPTPSNVRPEAVPLTGMRVAALAPGGARAARGAG